MHIRNFFVAKSNTEKVVQIYANNYGFFPPGNKKLEDFKWDQTENVFLTLVLKA